MNLSKVKENKMGYTGWRSLKHGKLVGIVVGIITNKTFICG